MISRSGRLLFFLALFFGLVLIGTRIDTDDWFLLNCGRYVASYGIPHVEPFTLHEGFHYVMQQWLFALGLWELYCAFGLMGLVGFAYAGGALVIFLYDRLVHVVAGGGDTRVAELLLVLPVGGIISNLYFYPRPQVVSMAFFLCEVLLLERYHSTRPRWLFVLLPAMSTLLVNFHAALWPMFLILQLPYLVEALFGGRLTRWLPHDAAWQAKEIVLLLVLCAVAGLCNPYGVEALTYTALSYTVPDLHTIIDEVRPLSLDTPPRIWFGSFFFLIYFGLTALYARHPQPLRYLLLAAGTGFLGLLSIRSLFLFLVFATVPMARLLAGRTFSQPAWTRRRKAVVALLLAANVFLLATRILPARYTVPPVPLQLAAAVDALDRLAADAGKRPQDFRVYTESDTGSYTGFRGYRCYKDSRAEVYFKTLNRKNDAFREWLDLERGQIDYRDVLEKYRFDALLVCHGDILWRQLDEDSNYVCVWDSEDAGIKTHAMAAMRIYQKK